MSLYHEAADILTAPNDTGGSLKSRIFSSKTLKSQPAQLYALVIETCKWSFILKEVVERASLLSLERKVFLDCFSASMIC
jgi:putative methyltransferase